MIFRSLYIIIRNSSEKIMRFFMRPAISHLLVCSLHHKISIKIQINALNVRKINHPSFSSHFKNLCCTRRIESFCFFLLPFPLRFAPVRRWRRTFPHPRRHDVTKPPPVVRCTRQKLNKRNTHEFQNSFSQLEFILNYFMDFHLPSQMASQSSKLSWKEVVLAWHSFRL